jgi:redox-sensing transcriptional repressor
VGVDVRKVDLSIELQILAFHAQRRSVVRVAQDGKRHHAGRVMPADAESAIGAGGMIGESAVAAP